MRIWRKTPYLGLAVLFGISESTMVNYYDEVLEVFSTHLTPRLLYPLSAAQITPMLSEEVKFELPGCLFAVDGTGLAKNTKENALIQRIMWSGYHNRIEFSVLVGKLSVRLQTFLANFMIYHFIYSCDYEWIIHWSVESFSWYDCRGPEDVEQ